jgi:hypothetical protein
MLWLITFLLKTIPPSSLVGGLIMFAVRPRLVMTVSEPRCEEIVGIIAAPFHANVLRLYVKNEGARQTEVRGFVEEIRKEGRIVDSEKSLLNSWADVVVDTDRMILGHGDSAYLNLCQLIETGTESLRMYSVKGDRGYKITPPGLYTFTVSVAGKGIHSAFRMNVEVHFDGKFESLRFGTSDNRTRELRLGTFAVNTQNLKRLISPSMSRRVG